MVLRGEGEGNGAGAAGESSAKPLQMGADFDGRSKSVRRNASGQAKHVSLAKALRQPSLLRSAGIRSVPGQTFLKSFWATP